MRAVVLLIFFPLFVAAQLRVEPAKQNLLKVNALIQTGAQQTQLYLPLLGAKKVGVVGNHTSMVGDTHLVDLLVANGIHVVAVYAPEHGFRGDAGAGETIRDGRDAQTGLPIFSLYGSTKKPTVQMLEGIDVLVFDMQDVGARFYTYLSTLHYVMEAAAEQKIPVVVLDRPNPNGFYTDGPVLKPSFSSFVGMHPIPLVHGMTLGELAQMINGEGWLKGKVKAELTVISCANYRKSDLFLLQTDPSPNLTSMEAIYLYPSLCLFEPTVVSIGRGTDAPFEIYGHPEVRFGNYQFTPESRPGKAPNPKHKGKLCYGQNVSTFGSFYPQTHRRLYLDWLLATYAKYTSEKGDGFFTEPDFFDKLAGTDQLRKQIIAGRTSEEIRASWVQDLKAFAIQRAPYLLYEE